MDSFSKRLIEFREAQSLSQNELVEAFVTSHSTKGKYELNEMNPSIDSAKKLAETLDTFVRYLLSEVKQNDTFKDTYLLKRFNDVINIPDSNKEHILYAFYNLLASDKNRLAYK